MGSREDKRGRYSGGSEGITAGANSDQLLTWGGPVEHIQVETVELDTREDGSGFVFLEFGMPALDPYKAASTWPQVRVKLTATHARELLLELAGQLLAGAGDGDEAVRDALAAQLTGQQPSSGYDPWQALSQLTLVREAWTNHFGPHADPPDMDQVAETARAQTAAQTRITEQHVRELMDCPLPHAALYLVNDEAAATVRVCVSSLAQPPSEHLLAVREDLLAKASGAPSGSYVDTMVLILQQQADAQVRAMFPHLYPQHIRERGPSRDRHTA